MSGIYKTEIRFSYDKEDQRRAIEYIKNRGSQSISAYLTAAILHYEETILPQREESVLSVFNQIKDMLLKQGSTDQREDANAYGRYNENDAVKASEDQDRNFMEGQDEGQLNQSSQDFLKSLGVF